MGSGPLDWLGLSAATPQGAAVAKISSEVLPVRASLPSPAYPGAVEPRVARPARRLGSVSLGVGLLATVPLLVRFAVDPVRQQPGGAGPARGDMGAWLPRIVVFSLANGFIGWGWGG